MEPAQHRLIAALHDAPTKCVLALTGGGATAVSALLAVPGASRTVLECYVPYHDSALSDFLGFRPAHFCSAETARAMARRAFERAERLAPREPAVGFGCTASLATDRPRRGEHRFHICVFDDQQMLNFSLTLTKDARDRATEEHVVGLAILNALAGALGVTDRLDVPLLEGEQPEIMMTHVAGPLSALQRGDVSILCQEIDGRLRVGGLRPATLLCGSFNPLHAGHARLAEVAANRLGVPVAFELGVINADKAPLTTSEVRRRLRQFIWRGPIWLSRAPTFAEKAQHFPGTTFIVGADTASRIIAPQFYGASVETMHNALARFRAAGCRFAVAGRIDASGRFLGADDVPVPEQFRDLFIGIPQQDFRVDLSSTDLRNVGH